MLDEFAGVDVHGAGAHAQGVNGAGLFAHIFVVFIQLRNRCCITFLLCFGASAANDNALARREREIFRRADWLAVSALHAGINFSFHRGVELDVADVRGRVFIQDDPGVEDAARVNRLFQLLHHLIELTAVLASHEGRHGAAGAVFSFEVSFSVKDEINHVIGKFVVAREVLLPLKAVREQEVNIAVFGMAKNHCVIVAIGVK